MDFKTSILWSGRLYKLLEKFNLDNRLNLDSIVDNNLPQILSKLQSYATKGKIAICQTNGKITTASILNQILASNDNSYISNITPDGKKYPPLTSIILNLSKSLDIFASEEEKEYYSMIMNEFELDNYFNSMKFDFLLLGNLFVDQKDFVTLEEKKERIQNAISLNSKLDLIINADEPMFNKIDDIKNDTILNKKRNKFYYGFNNIEFGDYAAELSQKNDIPRCPNCGCILDYKKNYYSHIGNYNCACGFKRPNLNVSAEAKIYADYCFLTVFYQDNKMVFKLPLGGVENAYNALGAISIALYLGIERKIITSAFENYSPPKARGNILTYKNKQIKIKIIKNPVSLSVALRELYASKNKKVVFCLNDNELDGIDTSWIWDSNFNSISYFENKIYVTGNRFDDIALRLKYANVNPSLIVMEGSIKNAIQCCCWDLEKNETMLILTTPSLVDNIYETLKK
ncbi:MAG: DUF1727 domain-containing protein [Candidatus Gastranaerophilales bacterium]|nr:DUF1727 domain-containing protein [Candidatus Gastranaerophilales bacterium]